MADIFIPTLHTFAMDNLFTGSCGALRFRLEPKVVKVEGNNKEVDFEKSTILAKLWHGPFCYEKSEMEQEQTFPMTEEGRLAMKAWLEANI